MKQKFILGLSLLAIAGLWTGCANDDTNEPAPAGEKQEISFRVQGGMPETKATGTTPANVDAFVVYGTDNLATANIFNGVTVARQVGGAFDYNPKKYYSPSAASANFVAYSPASAAITTPVTTALIGTPGTASFTYTVAEPDALAGNTKQEDLLIAGTEVATPATVNLPFQHALSRIFVKATNAMDETVVIKSLKLKHLRPSGTIAGTAAATWTWAWTASGTLTDYSYVLAKTGVAVPKNSTPTLVTSMEQGMMVIPQPTDNKGSNAATGDDFALEVVYDMANLTNQKEYVYLTDGYPFAAGKQYAITIAFSSTAKISFTISVSDFTNDVDGLYPVIIP